MDFIRVGLICTNEKLLLRSLLDLLLNHSLSMQRSDQLRQLRCEVISRIDRILIVLVQVVVIVFNILLDATSTTQFVTYSGASAESGLLFKEKALFLYLQWKDSAVGWYLHRFIYSHKSTELRV